MNQRNLTFFDRCILQADQALRTIFAEPVGSGRENPARSDTDEPLSATEKAESISLMRINHAGEVCAQALYQGQALTAKLPEVREEMRQAASEEVDHLVWCEERLRELDSRPSVLNPAWYGLSFALGAIAGARDSTEPRNPRARSAPCSITSRCS